MGLLSEQSADYMGMLATAINGIAIQEALEHNGLETRLLSAINHARDWRAFYCKKSQKTSWKGESCNICWWHRKSILYNGYSSTTLRASEIEADILIKATKVDGVFNKDPNRFDDAIKLDKISYNQALSEHIKVMDDTSIGSSKR